MTTQDPVLLPYIHAIEAPFTITQTFMTMSVVLFLIEFWMMCFKRAFMIGVVGLICYASEYYAHFTVFLRPNATRNFRRLFAADSGSILLFMAITLGICMTAAGGVTLLFFRRRRIRRSVENAAVVESLTTEELNLAALKNLTTSTTMRLISYISLAFLPGSFIASVLGMSRSLGYNPFSDTASSDERWTRTSSILRLFFPRSSASLSNLDQVVAVLGGAAILSSTLYSFAKSWYVEWVEAERRQQQQQEAWVRMTRLNLTSSNSRTLPSPSRQWR